MKTLKSFISVFGIIAALSFAAFGQTSLTSVDGGRFDVQAQKGKVVILAVGATWLPLSAKQAEYTNALAKKYAGRNVAIYFVATDSATPGTKNFASSGDIGKFASANKLSVTILRDSDGATVLKKFNIEQLPSFVILDKNGTQVGDAFGGIDPKFDITIPISKAVDGLM